MADIQEAETSGAIQGAAHTSARRSRSALGFMALRANRPDPRKRPVKGILGDADDIGHLPRRMALPDGNRFGLRRTTATHSFDEYPEHRRYW